MDRRAVGALDGQYTAPTLASRIMSPGFSRSPCTTAAPAGGGPEVPRWNTVTSQPRRSASSTRVRPRNRDPPSTRIRIPEILPAHGLPPARRLPAVSPPNRVTGPQDVNVAGSGGGLPELLFLGCERLNDAGERLNVIARLPVLLLKVCQPQFGMGEFLAKLRPG